MSHLDEKERRGLAACVSQFPANMRTLHVRYLRSTNGYIRSQGEKKADIVCVLARLTSPALLNLSRQVAKKIKSGDCLSDEDVELVNLALYADRHGLLFVVIPAATQVEDLAQYLNNHPGIPE